MRLYKCAVAIYVSLPPGETDMAGVRFHTLSGCIKFYLD